MVAASGTPYDVLTQYGMNFHEPYLRAILGFIGITDIEFLTYSGRGEELINKEIEQSKTDTTATVEKYATSQS